MKQVNADTSVLKNDWKNVDTRVLSPYVVVPEVFSHDECSAFIEAFDCLKRSEAETWDGEKFSVNPSCRSLEITRIPISPDIRWIYERMDKVFFWAADLWGLDVRRTIDDIKYLVYSAGSHFSKWHRDAGYEQTALRKISMSVELSDPSEYEGGEFYVFPDCDEHVAGSDRQAGHAVVFPSHHYHRVTKVTKGTRRALLNWISGPTLR